MSSYQYGGVSYANPDAVTQIATGLSTTTFQVDNDGNVVQKLTDGVLTTYQWDYANRLIAVGVNNASTTYGYDAFGARVLQIGTSTTNIYPVKWYSVASSTGSGAKYATTTSYVFNGDTLLSTIDQQFASGNATGSAQTHFIHPDHLGSTDVVTDSTGAVSQNLSYYPYGATRISTGQNATKRQYIGQFTDDSSLSYLNARYYDSSRGQFLSQDPSFLGTQQNLKDPQTLNSYSYANGNPISNKDPLGLWAILLGPSVTIPGWGLTFGGGIAIDMSGIDYYYNTGLAAGGQLGFAQITTGDLDHQYSVTGSTFATGGGGLGVEISKGTTYYPYTDKKPKLTQEASFGTRGGLGAGVVTQVSGPLITWGSSLTNYVSSAKQLPTATWMGSLPLMLLQNGSVYYRNSSGLLSSTPQSTTSSGGTNSGGGSTNSTSGGGGSPQGSSNNGGWGSTHSACGTLCS
jgi:RHS repeat-associated protein